MQLFKVEIKKHYLKNNRTEVKKNCTLENVSDIIDTISECMQNNVFGCFYVTVKVTPNRTIGIHEIYTFEPSKWFVVDQDDTEINRFDYPIRSC